MIIKIVCRNILLCTVIWTGYISVRTVSNPLNSCRFSITSLFEWGLTIDIKMRVQSISFLREKILVVHLHRGFNFGLTLGDALPFEQHILFFESNHPWFSLDRSFSRIHHCSTHGTVSHWNMTTFSMSQPIRAYLTIAHGIL
jgi:hypothetical protein